MPFKAESIDLVDPHEGPLLYSLEVSDPHVWDAESITPIDQAPPLRNPLEDFVSPLSTYYGQGRQLKRNRDSASSSTGRTSDSSSRTPAHSSRGSSSPKEDGQGKAREEKRRSKHYKQPTPSKFCHVCGRKSCKVVMAVCSRIKDGLCRKVVCEFCFEKYDLDANVIDDVKRMQQKEGKDVGPLKGRRSYWECPHCAGKCVAKAQCNTYGKTNYKRHLKLRRKRSQVEEAKGSGNKKCSSK